MIVVDPAHIGSGPDRRERSRAYRVTRVPINVCASRRRCASRAIRLHRPGRARHRWCGSPCGTACHLRARGRSRSPAGFAIGEGRRPSPDTGPSRKVLRVAVSAVAGDAFFEILLGEMSSVAQTGCARVHSRIVGRSAHRRQASFQA